MKDAFLQIDVLRIYGGGDDCGECDLLLRTQRGGRGERRGGYGREDVDAAAIDAVKNVDVIERVLQER
jgi:hypothetical protein